MPSFFEEEHDRFAKALFGIQNVQRSSSLSLPTVTQQMTKNDAWKPYTLEDVLEFTDYPEILNVICTRIEDNSHLLANTTRRNQYFRVPNQEYQDYQNKVAEELKEECYLKDFDVENVDDLPERVQELIAALKKPKTSLSELLDWKYWLFYIILLTTAMIFISKQISEMKH
ncbi:hypothetical protein L596_028673 [Steinernema carpocapsae]|uniref:Uncharacterized protein n=1 Tax=Steinernema carpocapsae TaxID=34508 RepID=A0A4U5LZ36_STECR|nr:hypothetical protein L596_028673 [Steinernema carpocapsae]